MYILKTLIKNGLICEPSGISSDRDLLYEDGRIICIAPSGSVPGPFGEIIDAAGAYVTPGFIDLHVHGGGGRDFMEPDPAGILTAARAHLEHGTTTLLPTSCTSANEELFAMFAAFREARKLPNDGAELYGIHLEGPYLNPKMKGAMLEELITLPLAEFYLPVLEKGCDIIKRWTVAPELAGAFEFASLLASKGMLVSAGHTAADPDTIYRAADHGFSLATHLFNAMTSMHKEGIFRRAGAAEGALLCGGYDVEIVADGVHLPKELLLLVYRLKGSGRTALITDSASVAGMPLSESGRAILASRTVLVENGVAVLEDRSAIAGSIATTDVLLKTAVSAGIPLYEAITMLTATPAHIAGMKHKGRLASNMDADILLVSDKLDIINVIKSGRRVYGA